MDDTKQRELQAARQMVETMGWAIYVRDTKARIDQLRDLAIISIKTQEELWYAKGVYDTLNALVRYEDVIEAAERAVTDGDGEENE